MDCLVFEIQPLDIELFMLNKSLLYEMKQRTDTLNNRYLQAEKKKYMPFLRNFWKKSQFTFPDIYTIIKNYEDIIFLIKAGLRNGRAPPGSVL